MTAAAHFDALAGRLSRSLRRGSLPDRVRQGFQVVRLGRFVRLADGEPDDIPAPRRGHPVSMARAEVVAVGFNECRQRAEDGRRVPVDVGERVQGDLLAGGTGALASGQLMITPVSGRLPAERSTSGPGSEGS